jgi:hypothetical protein
MTQIVKLLLLAQIGMSVHLVGLQDRIGKVGQTTIDDERGISLCGFLVREEIVLGVVDRV